MPPETSPEERLLRLIRGESGKKDQPGPARPASRPGVAAGESVPSELDFGVHSHKPGGLPRRQWSWVNRLLILAFLCAAGFAFYEIVIKKPELDRVIPVVRDPSLAEEERVQDPGPNPVRLDAILRDFSGRDFFQAPIAEEGGVAVPDKAVLLKDLVAPLVLMGVVDGNPPQAIIQDQESEQTYFLYEGDKLGQLRVQKVRSGLVTLGYQGEETDLRF